MNNQHNLKSSKKITLILIFVFCSIQFYGQTLSYEYFTIAPNSLKEFLLDNDDYFSGGTSDLPYFQGKSNNIYIKFYRAIGTTVIYEFKSDTEYLKLIREIKNKANFRFKYCTSYNDPIVYNYQTTSGNKIRFNFSENRISIEYPSKLNSFLNENSEFTPVFVCVSEGAYAYHTNLKCEGLANCDAQIAKSNIKEVKKFKYRICEICTIHE